MTLEHEAFRRAFDFALDALVVQLGEAQAYIGGDGTDNMAIGALVDIEETFQDFLAARRLFINSKRRS